MIALVSTPSSPSRRPHSWVAPLAVGAVALLLYGGVFLLPALFQPVAGGGTLAVLEVEPGGRMTPVPPDGALPGGTRVAFSVRVIRDASVVLVGMEGPGRTTLLSPPTPPPRRIHPGTAAVLPERWTLAATPGSERFLAVLCNTPLPPATVLKAAERALQAAGGDPGRIQTLDLGCAEAFAGVRRTGSSP